MDGKPSADNTLRLRAMDQDDLQVIAACLQDALVPLREMAFMADERRFMAAFNRFQWEQLADPDDVADLTLCQSALRVEHVESVQYRGLDGDLDGIKFELLTVVSARDDAGGFKITLLFAGDVAIRLTVRDLLITLEDFGDSWTAEVVPQHDLPDMSPQGS